MEVALAGGSVSGMVVTLDLMLPLVIAFLGVFALASTAKPTIIQQ